jgi:hypothetical protein
MCRLGLPGRKVRCVDGATNFSVKKTHVIIGVKNPVRRLWPFDVATNDAQFCPNHAQPFFWLCKVRYVDGATANMCIFIVKKTHLIIGVNNPVRRLWPFDVATNDAQLCPNHA